MISAAKICERRPPAAHQGICQEDMASSKGFPLDADGTRSLNRKHITIRPVMAVTREQVNTSLPDGQQDRIIRVCVRGFAAQLVDDFVPTQGGRLNICWVANRQNQTIFAATGMQECRIYFIGRAIISPEMRREWSAAASLPFKLRQRSLAAMAKDAIDEAPHVISYRKAVEVRDDVGSVLQVRFTFDFVAR